MHICVSCKYYIIILSRGPANATSEECHIFTFRTDASGCHREDGIETYYLSDLYSAINPNNDVHLCMCVSPSFSFSFFAFVSALFDAQLINFLL